MEEVYSTHINEEVFISSDNVSTVTVVGSVVAPVSGSAMVRGRRGIFSLPEMRWAAWAVTFFLVGLCAQLADAPIWVWWSLYLACYATGGWEPALAGLRALREKTLDVDLLMVIAAIGAASIGQITDGALLIVIFATSGALEALATAKTEDSVRGLLDLAPDTATLVTADGAERIVRVSELAVADVLLVRPGERIAADATVMAGASEVDQATITGEPLPVDKSGGDEVFAGTLNGTGVLRIRVDRRAQDSVVARIAALVQQASATKARTQLFIEKVEQRYSIGMVAVSIAVFVVPLLAGDTLRSALLRAMTFMIVASPCAVVLATMPPLLAAIANAGRHGVLVKSAVVMERLGTTDLVAFDKTGTLTRGTPELVDIAVLSADFTDDEVLTLAAAVERASEHPLGAAVVRAAKGRGLSVPDAVDFVAQPGRGVRAVVDRRVVAVGSPMALDADGIAAAARVGGRTAVVVTVDRRPVAVLALADQLRADAPSAVSAAAELTGRPPVLLTGDNRSAARAVADRVGIVDVRSGLLPHEKVSAVTQLQADGAQVMMVGDGVNDAPALAAAHVGIALRGVGSDLTLQTADAVVISDELGAIPAAIALARAARRVVAANLAIAAAFIVALAIWDLTANLPLPLGVVGHEGSTVIVGLNGLRLLRKTAWRRGL
jgi:heavy metal translocating P-type ATPase